MADEERLSPDGGENTMLNEAIEFLRRGDRTRAREILTRLLKTDQNNATYWVWLSAVVESSKERLYCLQTALKIEPENVAAKRGLVLLGGIPPDDSVPPFPMNHPRAWEEKLKIPQEPKPKRKGWANPLVRLFVVLGGGALLIGLVFASTLLPRSPTTRLFRTPTRRPTVTITLTPTNTPLFRTATATFAAPTPLWMLLDATYTPTPLYVVTEHPITSKDAFNAAMRYFRQADYQNAISLFEQVLTLEPEAADVHYYIGECYRLRGENYRAYLAYQAALDVNSRFAPGYLGRAITLHILNPEYDFINDLNRAITYDPQYTAAYMERGRYRIEIGAYESALSDLGTARAQKPGSALVHLYLAQAQLALGRNRDGLASALEANRLDLTLLDAYLVMAQAYAANGMTDQAVGAMQTYTLYYPNDAEAFLILGTAYNAAGEHEAAIAVLDRAIGLNRRMAEAYYQRGYAYLTLGEGENAEDDFKLAVAYDPSDFDGHLGLALAFDMQGFTGDAYIQIERNVVPLANTDVKRTQLYYWQAIILDKLEEEIAARRNWRLLLELPENVTPPEWRTEAMERLGITPTPSPTRNVPTRTPTPIP
ncbi:MAG: tetratricopeptide repeat protein [Chloroflexota bacterium]